MRNFIRQLKSWIVNGLTVGNHTYNLSLPSPPMAGEVADYIKEGLSNLPRSFQSLFSAAVDVIAHSNPKVDDSASRTGG
jgi:hypothetical protein